MDLSGGPPQNHQWTPQKEGSTPYEKKGDPPSTNKGVHPSENKGADSYEKQGDKVYPIKDIPLRKKPQRNNGMSKNVELIELSKDITGREKEAKEYKDRHCGDTACGDQHWNPGTREKWVDKGRMIKALMKKHEDLLLDP